MRILCTADYSTISIQGNNDELFKFGTTIRDLTNDRYITTDFILDLYYHITLKGVKLKILNSSLLNIQINKDILEIAGDRESMNIFACNLMAFKDSSPSEHYHFDYEGNKSWIAPTKHSIIVECR